MILDAAHAVSLGKSYGSRRSSRPSLTACRSRSSHWTLFGLCDWPPSMWPESQPQWLYGIELEHAGGLPQPGAASLLSMTSIPQAVLLSRRSPNLPLALPPWLAILSSLRRSLISSTARALFSQPFSWDAVSPFPRHNLRNTRAHDSGIGGRDLDSSSPS